MNWPNSITFSRLLLIPIYLLFLPLVKDNAKHIFSIFIITIGSVLDVLDGYIARKYNMATNLGKILDPLADKLLLVTVGMGLWFTGRLPLWLILFIVIREAIMILGGTINYLYTKVAISANALGKLNTCYVYVLILSYSFRWSISTFLAWGFITLVLITTLVYLNIFINKLATEKLAK